MPHVGLDDHHQAEEKKRDNEATICLGLVFALPALAAEEGPPRSTVDALSFSVEPR